ncbi:LysR substrate-binding domain-containing protein [Saccharibacillus sacchari]|uniref:LysR substrate-binding domain-containing protein n=1 Tax=Saccharibacillus sacchari TaxID=456493 RepID=A0ACC6PC35_9BACL
MDQQLRIFMKVVEKGNFSRAADFLHMTQPAVSQHIRTLEQSVGAQLLERTNKYVRLTKAGEIVYAHARDILGLYGRMQHLVDDLSNHAGGPLTIGASYTFGEYILPRIVAELKSLYPDISPSVTIGNTFSIAEQVRTGELDVGIVEGHPRDMKELQAEGLAEDRMVLVSSPSSPVESLDAHHTWILRETGSGTREAADDVLERLGVTPAETLVFSSTQAIKEAVIAGLGISLLSQWAIRRELASGELKIIDVPLLPHIRQFSIVTGSPFRTKALDVFLELLRERRDLTGLAP